MEPPKRDGSFATLDRKKYSLASRRKDSMSSSSSTISAISSASSSNASINSSGNSFNMSHIYPSAVAAERAFSSNSSNYNITTSRSQVFTLPPPPPPPSTLPTFSPPPTRHPHQLKRSIAFLDNTTSSSPSSCSSSSSHQLLQQYAIISRALKRTASEMNCGGSEGDNDTNKKLMQVGTRKRKEFPGSLASYTRTINQKYLIKGDSITQQQQKEQQHQQQQYITASSALFNNATHEGEILILER